MAEIKLPIKIDGFKCVEDMTQAVLNYTYKGKTLKEWADSISEPQTNADNIRAMTDEQLAQMFSEITDCANCIFVATPDCTTNDASCRKWWLNWLKQEAILNNN